MRVLRMRAGRSLTVSSEERLRLLALVRNRNSPRKHVWRGQIVLLTADGVGANEIIRRTGKSKTCVWRWRERFAVEGCEGLARDKTRPSRVKPLADEFVARVVALTLEAPPGETTHWTGALMARASDVSVSSVHRIWRIHGLQPHRMRPFKLSNDPKLVEKPRDVVGLYVNPPAHAIVLSLDEKSQIQALDRTQPGLPLKKGRAGTMTHDYKQHGATTLFAAMNILDGTAIHVILDNYAAHKHPKVLQWLTRHPRFVFHFTPASCSWLNAVEGLFRHSDQTTIETRRLQVRRRPAGRDQPFPPGT